KLTDLKKTDILVGMANMTQQAPLGTMENVLIKIDKFVFPCDFIVIDMPGILGEMMILDKPFLATIHAQIDVFNGEISFRIGEDRVKCHTPRRGLDGIRVRGRDVIIIRTQGTRERPLMDVLENITRCIV
ncbi:putative reverse transcriptase domain-containing protein, partial [Tanacetum coccineum]